LCSLVVFLQTHNQWFLNMTHSTKGILLAATTAIMWGVLAIALKIALNYIDSYTIVWWRFTASFLTLAVFMGIRNPRSLNILKRPPWLLLLAGLLLGINFIGFQQGVFYSGPAVTQIIIQAGPVLLALTGFLFFKEVVTTVRITGFILAAIGFFFFYQAQLESLPSKTDLQTGVLWTLIGALTWTGYAIINKVMVRKTPPMQVNLILYGLPMLLYIPLADFGALFQFHSVAIWLLFLFLAFNTLLAYGSLSMALKYTEANKISIIVTLNPIITFILLEILLWGNVHWFDSPAMAPLAYVGAIIVLAGAVLAVGARKRKINAENVNPLP
jgi:drug/metabolite transporter (DMT)-like permease